MKTVHAIALLTALTISAPMFSHANEVYRSNAAISNLCNEARFDSYASLALSMRDYVTASEYQELYLPLKKYSTIAKMNLKVHGAMSATTQGSVLKLTQFVALHEKEFDKLWEVEAFEDVVLDLMTVTATLEQALK